MHGRLAIELGSILYFRPSPQTHFPQSFTPSTSTLSSSSTPSSLSPSSSNTSSSFRHAMRQDNVDHFRSFSSPCTSPVIPILSPVAPTVQSLSTPTLHPLGVLHYSPHLLPHQCNPLKHQCNPPLVCQYNPSRLLCTMISLMKRCNVMVVGGPSYD